jgi:hypothetical protein
MMLAFLVPVRVPTRMYFGDLVQDLDRQIKCLSDIL